DGDPLAPLATGIDGIQPHGQAAFEVLPDGLRRQHDKLIRPFTLRTEVVVAAGFRVGLHGLESVSPTVDEQIRIVLHDPWSCFQLKVHRAHLLSAPAPLPVAARRYPWIGFLSNGPRNPLKTR